MKIAHLSDIHLTNSKDDSHETLGEQVERLMWIASDAHDNGAVLTVVAGDTFHAKSNAAERNAAIRVYRELARRAPVVVVRGNNSHDGHGEISFLNDIRSDYPITAVERPKVIEVDRLFVDRENGMALVLAMPFPEKAWLAAANNGEKTTTQMAHDALKALFLHWAVKAQESELPVVLVGHLELGSATLDSGQPAVGKCFVELSDADLLEIGADYYALGHIHKHQVIGDSICYAGSPRQTSFGEDEQKGYCLVEVQRGETPVIEHRRAHGPKLVTIEAAWDTETGRLTTEEDYDASTWWKPTEAGDIFRLVYSISEANRASAAEQADKLKSLWLDAGARSVKIDARTVAITRVRSENLRVARTNADRLEAYWSARSEKPERAETITAKLDELEEEVANAV